MTSLAQELLQQFSTLNPDYSQSLKNVLYESHKEQYDQLIPLYTQFSRNQTTIEASNHSVETNVIEHVKDDVQANSTSELVSSLEFSHPPSFSEETLNSNLTELAQEQQDVFQYLKLRFESWLQLSDYISNYLQYANVVLYLIELQSLNQVQSNKLENILPNSIIIQLKMNIGSLKHQNNPFDQQESSLIIRAANDILNIEKIRLELLKRLELRMKEEAPNISELVGTRIAAQLLGTAGGIQNFAKLTADNIQQLGRVKEALMGLSSKTQVKSFSGFISNLPLLEEVHPKLRKRIEKMIANKLKLVSNIDALRKSRDGSQGRQYLQEIKDAIANMEKPPPKRQEKPLPAPVLTAKKRRGGSKSRHLKEIRSMSAVQQLKSRIKFGVEQVVDEYTGEEYGMLGVESLGTNRLLGALQPKIKQKSSTASSTSHPFYGGTVTQSESGIVSSLAFSATQGMQLPNPKKLEKKKQTNRKTSYFSHIRPFSCCQEQLKESSLNSFTIPATLPKKRQLNES